MYVICAYDVDQKRCNKVMKILRKYLFHVQNSVFDGTLTPKQFKDLKSELKGFTTSSDSILFYLSYNDKQVYKEQIGKVEIQSNIIIKKSTIY